MKKQWLVTLAFAFGVWVQESAAQEPRLPQFPRDIHGLWWQPIDPGWATAVFDHQTAMSSVLMIYDFDGTPTWLVAPRLDCFREGSAGLNANCLGPMYRVTAPWFGETFRNDQVTVNQVGEWEGWWGTPLYGGVGPNEGRVLYLTYSYLGRSVVPFGDQPMKAQVIDPDQPFLFYNTSQSGLWADPDESGWGVGLFQQGQRLSATLFVHGRDRQPRWYVVNMKAPDLIFDADRLYTGDVYETRGSPFAERFSAEFRVRRVGGATLRFGTGPDGPARLNYSIDGVSVSKTILRVP